MSLDFISRALIAGIGVALAAGPLGTIMVWRRMSNFGDALAHSTLLGLCLALFFNIHVYVGLTGVCLLIGCGLTLFSRSSTLGSDAILSILAYATLSVGLILATTLKNIRIDLLSYLYGDILAVNNNDLFWIYGVVLIAALALWQIGSSVLSMTVHQDLASVEGVSVARVHGILVLLMALVFAVAMKLVGILLITGLLIIPASAARYFSKTPEQMIILSCLFGVFSVCLGVFSSYQLDWPTGPAIVVVATLIFFCGFLWTAIVKH